VKTSFSLQQMDVRKTSVKPQRRNDGKLEWANNGTMDIRGQLMLRTKYSG
jgi:hypothetical protein